MLRRILIAVDFSEENRHALHYAAMLAAQCGASLTLAHVIEPGFEPPDIALAPKTGVLSPERRCAEAGAELRELSGQLLDACRVVETVVRNGIAFFEITEAAKALRADLIVVGTSGNAGLKRALLGSTVERIIRHAPCPVLVVRHPQQEAVI